MKHIVLCASVIALCSCTLAQQEPSQVRIESGSGLIKTETFATAIPSGTPDTPGHGKEVALAYGALSGVNGHAANGVGSVHIMEDKTSIVGVQLNIAVPEDGYFYAAWMEGQNNQRVLLGNLTNPFNDVRHSLQEEIDLDLRELTKLRITLEADDGNPEPGSTVAEGILRLTSR